MIIMTIGYVVRRGYYCAADLQVFNQGRTGGRVLVQRGRELARHGGVDPGRRSLGLLFANYPPLIEGPFRNVGGRHRPQPAGVDRAGRGHLPGMLFAFPEPRYVFGPEGPRGVPGSDGRGPGVVDDPRASAHRARARRHGRTPSGAGEPDGRARSPATATSARSTRPSSRASPARRPSPGCPASTRCPTWTSPMVGVPFDAGVSYRPGARFGPAHVRESSRLLRPYNPAAGRRAVRRPAGRRRR